MKTTKKSIIEMLCGSITMKKVIIQTITIAITLTWCIYLFNLINQ